MSQPFFLTQVSIKRESLGQPVDATSRLSVEHGITSRPPKFKISLLKPISDVYYVIQPNLGLGYLATIMLRYGHDVRILDSGKEKLSWNEFARRVGREQYDLIGIQMFTHEVPSVKRHTDLIKEFSPTTTVLVGGAHISGDPEGAMNLLEHVDFGFVGESEIGVEKFIQLTKDDYTNPDRLADVPSLVWRRNNEVVVNPRQQFRDLDEIELPAWRLMPPSSYPIAPHGSFSRRTPVAPLIISRGCPFECTFCAAAVNTGRVLRYRSVANAINEIKMLYHKYGIREIHIEDDNFTLKKTYVLDFCRAVIETGLDVVFALPNGVRLDTLDEEMLTLMERAGFYSLAVGVESGSDRVLELMKKKITTAQMREKIDLIKRCTDIQVTGFFLLGHPGETEAEVLQSLEFSRSLKLDKASFMVVMPLPGTPLQKYYRFNRNKGTADAENFFYYQAVEGLSEIPAQRLKALQRRAMWQFYYRPRIALNLLKQIRTVDQVNILLERSNNLFLKPAAAKIAAMVASPAWLAEFGVRARRWLYRPVP